MILVRVKRNYQITIPISLRRECNINVGDYMEIKKKQEGLMIKSVKMVQVLKK